MDEALRASIRLRARGRCEYCRMPEAFSFVHFEIDHIIARKHGGPTSLENLAFACLHCNSHKGPNLSGIDPITGRVALLFNPRRHRWRAHFRWDGAILHGMTLIGRATVNVLEINDADSVAFRQLLIGEGLFPG